MLYLQNEIINIILSFVERPQHLKIIKYVIEDCYKEDYDPYTAEYWYDNYCFEYILVEWYFYIEKIIFITGLKIQNINIHPK